MLVLVKNGKNENQVWRLCKRRRGCQIEHHNDRTNDDKGLIPVLPLFPLSSFVVYVTVGFALSQDPSANKLKYTPISFVHQQLFEIFRP